MQRKNNASHRLTNLLRNGFHKEILTSIRDNIYKDESIITFSFIFLEVPNGLYNLFLNLVYRWRRSHFLCFCSCQRFLCSFSYSHVGTICYSKANLKTANVEFLFLFLLEILYWFADLIFSILFFLFCKPLFSYTFLSLLSFLELLLSGLFSGPPFMTLSCLHSISLSTRHYSQDSCVPWMVILFGGFHILCFTPEL